MNSLPESFLPGEMRQKCPESLFTFSPSYSAKHCAESDLAFPLPELPQHRSYML